MAAVVLALMLVPRLARAAKVIPPGKEATIRAMLEPYVLGEVVRDEFELHDLRIDRDRVELSLHSATDAPVATLTLIPRASLDPGGSESFSFVFSGNEGARAAAE